MRWISFSSLRSRLVLIVVLGMIPALGLIFYTGWLQRGLAKSLVRENALRLARLAAMEEEQQVDGTQHFLISLAQHPAVIHHDVARCNELFALMANEHPNYAHIGLADPNGNVIAGSLPLKRAFNIADRRYFREALQNRGFSIGDYQVGRITGKATINFGYPVMDGSSEHRVTAILFAALDLNWLNKLLGKSQLSRDSTFIVMQRDGTILVRHPHPDQWIGKRLPNLAILKMILEQGEGTIETTGLDGAPRLFAYTPIGQSHAPANAYVGIGIPLHAAYVNVNRALAYNLAGLSVAFILALTVAWFGGNRFILHRIRIILRATRRLSQGDLKARTGLKEYGRGELGQLAQAFDEMAASLELRLAEREQAEQNLKTLNENLEHRVSERTHELSEKNQAMEDDLDMARDLQRSFLPQPLASNPRVIGPKESALRFYQRYHPSGRVGGDFFDMVAISDTEAGIFICDVMGNGVRAALVTAILRGLVEELKPSGGDAGRFLTEINRGLMAVLRQTGAPMFATAFYLIADVEKGQIRYSNAGHPNPLHLHRDLLEVEPLQMPNGTTRPALGLIENFVYPTAYAPLAPGDLVMLFTDGLYEVDSPSDKQFGQERLIDAVRQRAKLPPLKLFDELLLEIQHYSATNNFVDDVCLVGMEVTHIGQNSVARGETEAILVSQP